MSDVTKSHVSSTGNLAFVMPTHRPALGEQAANDLVASVAKSTDLVVLVPQNAENYPFTNLDPRVHLVRSDGQGATTARNEGIDFVLSTFGAEYLFIFPNDQSKYSASSITEVRHFSVSHASSIALGVWHISDFDIDLRESSWQNLELLNYRDAFTAYEPAMAVPGNVFEVIRFDNRIGTGSATYAQSGEAPDLVLNALKRGIPVRRLLGFVVENPSTTFRLNWLAGMRKIYRYACGSGYGYRRWSTDVGLLRSYAQIASPVLSYLTGKVYWRSMGLANALVATLGRIHGRFFISMR